MNDDPTVLLTPPGARALARAEEMMRAGETRAGEAGAAGRGGGELAIAARLRREFPADLAAAAMTQAELRRTAAAKFGRAGEMLFTRAGYEQASGEVVARHRAARFAGSDRIADLCCGIGGDLLALAAPSPPAPSSAVPSSATPAEPGAGTGESGRIVREILAVDRDGAHARLAVHNAGVYGAPAGGGAAVRAVVADVRDVPLDGFDAVFIDPARRGPERRFRAGVCEPPLEWCLALAGRVPAVCVKAAPGVDAGLIPPGWEAEFVADGRDLKEAALWSPAFASAGRRATVLPGGHTLTAVDGDPVPVAEPGEFLLDPSPAVTRAGLVEDLARTVGGWKIDERIAFLALREAVATPFGRTLRVAYSAPWDSKRFAARLRELGVGAADLRRRGLAGDVDAIRRRLKLAGPHRATLVLTRVANRPWGLICWDALRPPPGGSMSQGLPSLGLPWGLDVTGVPLYGCRWRIDGVRVRADVTLAPFALGGRWRHAGGDVTAAPFAGRATPGAGGCRG